MAKDKDKKRKERADPAGDTSLILPDPVASDVETPNKSKKQKKNDFDVPPEALSPIAHPLASHKLSKKLHKTIKKASKQRHLKRGVKEVVKSIRKGEKGLLILAADITPMDIISHLPVLSEEAAIPYVFVTSKEGLGQASSTKRPTSCVLVCPDPKKKRPVKEGETEEPDEEYRAVYDECFKAVKELDDKIVF